MKPRNFPARKLRRQLGAQLRSGERHQDDNGSLMNAELYSARQIRTKKRRGN